MKLRGNLMRINKEKANKKVMLEWALKMSEDPQAHSAFKDFKLLREKRLNRSSKKA